MWTGDQVPDPTFKNKQTKYPALCGGGHMFPGGGEVETGKSLGLTDHPV